MYVSLVSHLVQDVKNTTKCLKNRITGTPERGNK